MATITGTITREGGILNLNHDDTLFGTAGADTIDGIGGNDTIYAGLGSDTVRAGSGNDRVFASDGPSTVGLTGAWGNDTVYGDAGNELRAVGGQERGHGADIGRLANLRHAGHDLAPAA